MPQSLSVVYIHPVFSTKERRPFLRNQNLRERLHAYLGAVSRRLDCPRILLGGVEDHAHMLARFGRTITQAERVKELKRVSNKWPSRLLSCRSSPNDRGSVNVLGPELFGSSTTHHSITKTGRHFVAEF